MPGGDTIVAVLGVVLAAVILSRGSALRGMPTRKVLQMGLIWVAIFVAGVFLARFLGA